MRDVYYATVIHKSGGKSEWKFLAESFADAEDQARPYLANDDKIIVITMEERDDAN